jgi:hypothetical protein
MKIVRNNMFEKLIQKMKQDVIEKISLLVNTGICPEEENGMCENKEAHLLWLRLQLSNFEKPEFQEELKKIEHLMKNKGNADEN